MRKRDILKKVTKRDTFRETEINQCILHNLYPFVDRISFAISPLDNKLIHIKIN